jgi:hypothetical protein
MLSAVLRSARAVQMSIVVVQAFVRLREMIAANKDLAVRVEKLETGQRHISSILEALVGEIEHMKQLPRQSAKSGLISESLRRSYPVAAELRSILQQHFP